MIAVKGWSGGGGEEREKNGEGESEREEKQRGGPPVSVKSPQTIVRSLSRDITDPAVRLFRVRYAARMRNAAAFQALQSRCTAPHRAGASARACTRAPERGRASQRGKSRARRRRT